MAQLVSEMVDYPPTHWSLFEPASQGDREALNVLAGDYRGPLLLLALSMKLESHDAEDAVQSFFMSAIMGQGLLTMADRSKGPFRHYLARSFRNFVGQVRRRERGTTRSPFTYERIESGDGEAEAASGEAPRPGRKRKPGSLVSLDAVSEASRAEEETAGQIDRAWALDVLSKALHRAETHWKKTDPRRWKLYLVHDLGPAAYQTDRPSYEDICPNLGYGDSSVGETVKKAVKKASNDIITVKRSVQQHLRAVVREQIEKRLDASRKVRCTLAAPADAAAARDGDGASGDKSVENLVEEELRSLQQILSLPRPEDSRVRASRGVSGKVGKTRAPVSEGVVPLASQGGFTSDLLTRLLPQVAAQNSTESGISKTGSPGGAQGRPSSIALDPADYDLTRLLAAIREDAMDDLWATSPEDLRSLLAHYMSRPISFVLENLDSTAVENVRTRAGVQGLLVQSLGDLLHHRRPPVELLQATKAFARAHRQAACKAMPSEVATVLYYASIVAARVSGAQRISGLEDDQLRSGLLWVLDQTWIDDGTRRLIQEGLAFLDRDRVEP
jgi:DNA-directed RNA polymerase specialized sigma24 family protein